MTPIIEHLENRNCPSSVSLDGGVLSVVGSVRADHVTLTAPDSSTVRVQINQSAYLFAVSDVDAVFVYGRGGADNIQDFTGRAEIYSGRGRDFVYAIIGPNYVDGGLGRDLLAVSEAGYQIPDARDTVVEFFQSTPPGKIWLDSNGIIQIRPDNDTGTITQIDMTADAYLVTYTDSDEVLQLYFSLADVRGIGYFGGSGQDSFTNNTRLAQVAYGAGGDDTMIGGFGRGLLKGSGGNDTITGRGTRDDLSGNSGTDILNAFGIGRSTLRVDSLDAYFSLYKSTVIPS